MTTRAPDGPFRIITYGAVSYTHLRPQCGGKHGCGQEETGSNAKRPKRAGRPLFLTDLVVGASPTWGLSLIHISRLRVIGYLL